MIGIREADEACAFSSKPIPQLGRGCAVEHEIAQRIRNWAAMIKVERLNAVRMRANHEIDSVIDQPARKFTLFISDVLAVFNAPMNQANHQICA